MAFLFVKGLKGVTKIEGFLVRTNANFVAEFRKLVILIVLLLWIGL